MAVTTTSARQGGFEIRFWHRVFEEEVARVKGGFGPCNTSVHLSLILIERALNVATADSLAVHPQSKGYSIGGEDGYVRVHQSVSLSLSVLGRSLMCRCAIASMMISSRPSLVRFVVSLSSTCY